MYCGECGTKNEKGAKFCESCGAALEEPKKEQTKPTEKKKVERKPMSTKNKIIIGVVAAIVVVGVVAFNLLKSASSPETIAKNYYDAYVKQDANKMYSYCDLGEKNAFTSKEAYKNYYTSSSKAKKAKSIKNYKVSNVIYDRDNLTATVTISYTTGTAADAETEQIKLQKSSKKKFLFFDDWKVGLSTSDVATDYEIQVPTGAKVMVGKVELAESYKDESEMTGFDKYVIPMLFKTEYDVAVTLGNGFKIEDTIDPSNYYSSSTIRLTTDNISKEDKEKLENQIKTDIKSLYENAIADKEWKEISKNYGEKDSDDLKRAYESLKRQVDGGFFSDKISAFDISSVEVNRINTASDGNLEVSIEMEYKYTTVEEDGKTEEETNTDTAYVYYATENNSLRLVETSSLPNYF